jgi:hypothetical protein
MYSCRRLTLSRYPKRMDYSAGLAPQDGGRASAVPWGGGLEKGGYGRLRGRLLVRRSRHMARPAPAMHDLTAHRLYSYNEVRLIRKSKLHLLEACLNACRDINQ